MAKYRGHIQLIDNYLYFANDGKPFSRKGVLAITNPNLSDKTHNKFDEPVDQYEHIKNEKELKRKTFRNFHKANTRYIFSGGRLSTF